MDKLKELGLVSCGSQAKIEVQVQLKLPDGSSVYGTESVVLSHKVGAAECAYVKALGAAKRKALMAALPNLDPAKVASVLAEGAILNDKE